MRSGSEAGSCLRLIDSCITRLKAQGPSRTCNESKEALTVNRQVSILTDTSRCASADVLVSDAITYIEDRGAVSEDMADVIEDRGARNPRGVIFQEKMAQYGLDCLI